jgi:hypothetical protein
VVQDRLQAQLFSAVCRTFPAAATPTGLKRTV